MRKFMVALLVFSGAFAGCDDPKPGDSLFEKTIGFLGTDVGKSAQQTKDGGFIIAGSTNSIRSNADAYLLKTDGQGNTIWSKTFGGSGSDEAYAVIQTQDGGYVFTGNVTLEPNSNSDIYVTKTDGRGKMLWSNHLGSTFSEYGQVIRESPDGTLLVGGVTGLFGGAGSGTLNIFHLASHGTVLSAKTFSGDYLRYFDVTRNGEYILTGATGSSLLIRKLDTDDNAIWSQTFVSLPVNEGYVVHETTDGGVIVMGKTEVPGIGFQRRIYLIKTDGNGNTQWTKTYARSVDDEAYSMIQTTDGGYIMAGSTLSDAAVSNYDALIVKTNASGDTLWTRTFGGLKQDFFYSVAETDDHGYLVTGYTESSGAGHTDIYLAKIDENGNVK